MDSLIEDKRATYAAYLLASHLEGLAEIVALVDKRTLIKNCLYCYGIDFSAQPYLDEILSRFSIQELLEAYKSLEKKSIQTIGAFFWLFKDIDIISLERFSVL